VEAGVADADDASDNDDGVAFDDSSIAREYSMSLNLIYVQSLNAK